MVKNWTKVILRAGGPQGCRRPSSARAASRFCREVLAVELRAVERAVGDERRAGNVHLEAVGPRAVKIRVPSEKRKAPRPWM